MDEIDNKQSKFWDIVIQYELEEAITVLKNTGFELDDITGFIENHWSRL